REQLPEQRADQRAVHELGAHSVEAVLLEALAKVLELFRAVAVRVVQRPVTARLVLEARHLRADHGELIDRRVVLGRRRAARALAQRAHLLSAQRVGKNARALTRDVVLPRGERSALVDERVNRGFLVRDLLVY